MIIVLLGWRGSGKDTCADFLVKNKEFTRFAFADAVKDHASDLYDIPRELFDDPVLKNRKLEKFNRSPRDICILVGETAKKIDNNIWVNKVFNNVKNHTGNAIVTDCRFPVEYYKMKELNPVFIWIDRFSEIPNDCIGEISENSLSKSDAYVTIANKGTISDFHKTINSLLVNFGDHLNSKFN